MTTDLVPTLESINVLVSFGLEHQAVLHGASVSQDELRELELFSQVSFDVLWDGLIVD